MSLSMNCWRFDARIFPACRDVAPSPRGELELPLAVMLAVTRGVPFRAVPARGPVLDLSRARRRAGGGAAGAATAPGTMNEAGTFATRLVAAGLDDGERAGKTALFERVIAQWPPRTGERHRLVGARAAGSLRHPYRLCRRPQLVAAVPRGRRFLFQKRTGHRW